MKLTLIALLLTQLIVLLMRPSKCARITFSKVPFLRETKRLLSTDYALFDGRLSNSFGVLGLGFYRFFTKRSPYLTLHDAGLKITAQSRVAWLGQGR